MKNKIWFWLPRVLMVAYLIFISLFSLDELGNGLGFIIHLIPSFIVLIVTIYAWKNEFLGGLILIFWGVVFALYFHNINAFIAVCAPLIIIGLLFIRHNQGIKK